MTKYFYSLVLALMVSPSSASFLFAQDVTTLMVPNEITIPHGTLVEIESPFTVSSGEVKEGEAISFTVVHPVKINGVTVIAAGARATALIIKAKRGASWGRAGQLVWVMQDVMAVDGSKVPLELRKSKRGISKGGTVATGIIVTSVLFWPAAPYWGFKRGEDAKIPAGSRLEVEVQGNTTIRLVVSEGERPL